MKEFFVRHSNKIIGSIYIVIGLFLVVTNGIKVYADYYNEQQMLNEFYEKDKIAYEDDVGEELVEEEVKKKEYKFTKTTDYIEDSKYDAYVSVLKIPKINLEKGLFSKKSKYNDVEHNIMIHEKSDAPTVEKGNVILVAHSGTAEVSYFKNLNKLVIGDKSELYYHGKRYTYTVTKIYEVPKTGSVKVENDENKNSLTMITCKHDTDMQIVIISELESITEY